MEDKNLSESINSDCKSKLEEYKTTEKWIDIFESTLCNYSNMVKRLTRRKKFSNFILIYYSIALIIYPLTAVFFPKKFSTELSTYFGIIISVIILVYSIINSNSRYAERIAIVEESMNEIKNIKRDITNENLEDSKSRYIKICDNTERREDVDFFITLKQMCRKYDIKWFRIILKENDSNYVYIKKIKNQLSEINALAEQTKIILELVWNGIILIVPIIVLFICFDPRMIDVFCTISI